MQFYCCFVVERLLDGVGLLNYFFACCLCGGIGCIILYCLCFVLALVLCCLCVLLCLLFM